MNFFSFFVTIVNPIINLFTQMEKSWIDKMAIKMFKYFITKLYMGHLCEICRYE